MRTAHTRALAYGGERGFTLIELLVVISLISILAAMGVVQYRNSVQRTREATLRARPVPDARRDRPVLRRQGQVPGVARCAGERRLHAEDSRWIPSRSPPTPGRPFPPKPIPANPSAEPGIYDVKSGAPGTALDGSSYSEW